MNPRSPLKVVLAHHAPPPFYSRLEGGRKISSEIEAHEGPVYALYVYPAPDGSGTCVVTGGGDGKVKTWDSEVSREAFGRRWLRAAIKRRPTVFLPNFQL